MTSFFNKAKNAAAGLLNKSQHEAPKVTHTKKILLAVTSAAPAMPDHRSGFHWSELVQPYEVFVQNGWDVDIVSENGSATPDETSLNKQALAGDQKKWEDKEYTLHRKLAQIKPANQVNPADYCAIYFAGGHACVVDFPTAMNLKKLTAQIYENGGTVGSVCHGIAIFQNLTLSNGRNILEGKEATGFSAKGEEKVGAMDWMKKNNYLTMEQVVVSSGGIWKEHASDPMADYTCCSDRIVTGMNPASAQTLGKSMLTFLPKEEGTPAAGGINIAGHHIPADVVSGIQSKLGSLTGNKNTSAAATTQNQSEAEKSKAYQGETTRTI